MKDGVIPELKKDSQKDKHLFYHVTHLGDGVMVYCKISWWLLNIRQFFKDNEGHSCHTKNAIQIKFAYIARLLSVMSKIDDQYPALNKAVSCCINHDYQESYSSCPNCNWEQHKNV